MGEQKVYKQLNSLPKNCEQNVIQLIPTAFFDPRIHRFISANPLFQFSDNLNPLVDITQKRRLTGLGIGGLAPSTRNKKVRSIHPSHFGRLCPVETPDGENAGIVTSLRMIRQFSDDRIVQSITFKKHKSWLQNTSERIRLKPLVSVWKSSRKKDWITQFSIGLLTDTLGKFQSCGFETVLETGVNNFYSTRDAYVGIIGSLSIQALALSPDLIPFLQNNDANRVLIGASMLRQSLPTMKSLSPRVSSGVDVFVRSDSGQNLYALYSGIVIIVSREKVVIKRELPSHSIVAYYNILKSKKKKQTNKGIAVYFFPPDKKKKSTLFCLIAYTLGSISYTNQSTLCIQYPCVQIGNWVKVGDLLADGQASLFGCFSVGQNLIIAYMSWDRLNFEDGIITTQTMIKKETFTSVHSEKWYLSLTNADEVFIPFSPILFPYIIKRIESTCSLESCKKIFSCYHKNTTFINDTL